MGKRLFVGNLALDAKEEDLQKVFGECGKVANVTVIKSKFDPSQSRGFGFVEMETDAEAQNAITKLNGVELKGKKIAVEEAKPLDRDSGHRGPPRGGPGRDFGGGGRRR